MCNSFNSVANDGGIYLTGLAWSDIKALLSLSGIKRLPGNLLIKLRTAEGLEIKLAHEALKRAGSK